MVTKCGTSVSVRLKFVLRSVVLKVLLMKLAFSKEVSLTSFVKNYHDVTIEKASLNYILKAKIEKSLSKVEIFNEFL